VILKQPSGNEVGVLELGLAVDERLAVGGGDAAAGGQVSGRPPGATSTRTMGQLLKDLLADFRLTGRLIVRCSHWDRVCSMDA